MSIKWLCKFDLKTKFARDNRLYFINTARTSGAKNDYKFNSTSNYKPRFMLFFFVFKNMPNNTLTCYYKIILMTKEFIGGRILFKDKFLRKNDSKIGANLVVKALYFKFLINQTKSYFNNSAQPKNVNYTKIPHFTNLKSSSFIS